MISPRTLQAATLLPNGKVLLAGGSNGAADLSTAEIYDPTAGTFVATTGAMAAARDSHSATMLPNGKVLIAGGWNGSASLNSAELYDPTAGTFSSAGTLNATRAYHTATLLSSGNVLMAGGFDGSVDLTSAEIYLTWPAPPIRTGQTSCYDEAGTLLTSCTGTGQDGDTNAGSAWPNPRFLDNSDQTLTDKLTGLIWAKDANLLKARDPSFDNDTSYGPYTTSTVGDGKITWQNVLTYIAKLNTEKYLGYSDWRLPNIIEIESLVNLGQTDSSVWLISQGFTNVKSSIYRASSSVAVYTDSKYMIVMGNQEETNPGYQSGAISSNYSSVPYFLWPVRSGTSSGVINLPVTGQTTSYYAGDDGALRKGVVWPNPRFIDNGDQSQADTLTGLIWSKNANPAISKTTWQQALDYVKVLTVKIGRVIAIGGSLIEKK